MRRILLTLIFGVIAVSSVDAQEKDVVHSELNIEQSEFGEIPDSLYRLEADGEVPFEYLSKEAIIRFDESKGNIISIIDYHIRIKVYSDDELKKTEASIIGIPFYSSDDMEEIINIRAITHQPDGTKDALDESEVRTVDLNTRYKIREFTMPDVQKGSIIEYSYRVIRKYIEEL